MGPRLRPDGCYVDWEAFLNRMLSGAVRCYWTDKISSAHTPSRFLVKLVRANMMLGYLHARFEPRIVFIIRHPCAVVESRLDRGWHANLGILLRDETLVQDYLRPWLHEIESISTPLEAHAVWWALENAVALRDLAAVPHYQVTFEDLCVDGLDELNRIERWLGLEHLTHTEDRLREPSLLSRDTVAYGSTLERLSKWRARISARDCHQILLWAERFGVTVYDQNPLPRQPWTRVVSG
jgi:hypothetical protein